MALTIIALLLIVLFASPSHESGQPEQETNFAVIVEDQTGAPIRDAKARLLSLGRVLPFVSASDGRFLFTHLTPGNYDLEISARGFESKKMHDVRVPRSDAEPLEVTLIIKTTECGRSDVVDYVNLALQGDPIFGYVIDKDKNKPISKAQVDLSKAGEKRVLVTARSDKKGEFVFEHLLPGRYDLHVHKAFYRPADVRSFLVPRESSTKLTIFLDTADHVHVCQ